MNYVLALLDGSTITSKCKQAQLHDIDTLVFLMSEHIRQFDPKSEPDISRTEQGPAKKESTKRTQIKFANSTLYSYMAKQKL